MLSGDDEMMALLGSMEPVKRVPSNNKANVGEVGSKSASKQVSKPAGTSVMSDSRLSERSTWPDAWVLGPGIAHSCTGYTAPSYTVNSDTHGPKLYGEKFAAVCVRCERASATHRLVPSAGGSGSAIATLLLPFFAALRDIRCIAGEYDLSDGSSAVRHALTSMLRQELPAAVDSITDVHRCAAVAARPDMRDALLAKCEILSSAMAALLEECGGSNIPSKVSGSAHSGTISSSSQKKKKKKKHAQEQQAAGPLSSSSILQSHSGEGKFAILAHRLAVVTAADAAYYRLYYWATLAADDEVEGHIGGEHKHFSAGSNSKSGGDASEPLLGYGVPHPPDYFSCTGLAWDAAGAGAEAQRAFFGNGRSDSSDGGNTGKASPEVAPADLDETTQHLLLHEWGLRNSPSAAINPLLRLWQARWRETCRHFWASGWAHAQSSAALSQNTEAVSTAWHSHKPSSSSTKGVNDTSTSINEVHATAALCPALVAWRDGCRDFACALYAFATPSQRALDTVARLLVPDNMIQNGSSETGDSALQSPSQQLTCLPLVEVGAGTGYWAALIAQACKRRISHLASKTSTAGSEGSGSSKKRRRLAAEVAAAKAPIVLALDVSPPAPSRHLMASEKQVPHHNGQSNHKKGKHHRNRSNGAPVFNEYHGMCRAFMRIAPGDADAAPSALASALAAQQRGDSGNKVNSSSSGSSNGTSSVNSVLLLCYPPPGCNMALGALRTHRGEWVVHIGEWGGLTGNAQFEVELRQHFELINEDGLAGQGAECPLPSWGTDVASLTLWRRRTPDQMVASQGPPYLVPCAACGARATLRCRFARRLALCGINLCSGLGSETAYSSSNYSTLNSDSLHGGASSAPAIAALSAEEVRHRCASELALQMLHVPSQGKSVVSIQRGDFFTYLNQPT